MRRPISLLCIVFVAFAGVWFGAPAAGAGVDHCTGDIVVPIDTKLRAHPSLDSVFIPLVSPIPRGEYRVTTFSSDIRSAPVVRIQEFEQWTVTLETSAGPLAILGPTSDLEDLVEYASVADDLGRVTITDPVISLTARHVMSSGGGQSVDAECVALTLVGPADDEDDDGDDDDDGDEDESGDGAEPGDGSPVPDAGPGAGESDGNGGAGGDEPDDPAGAGPDPSVAFPRVRSDAIVDCTAGTISILVENEGPVGTLIDIAVPRLAVARAVEVGPGEISTTTLPLSP